MSSKDAFLYEEDQIEHFNQFISKCLQIRPDIIFIVGNLFGNSKPRNIAIENVKSGLNKLAEEGMKLFIIPGANDIPLPFTNDIPVHFIFENKNIKFLYNSEDAKKLKIEEPTYKARMGDVKINLFTTPSPLIKPTNIEVDLKIESESLNLFLMPDITSFKKDIEEIFSILLEKLNQHELDALLLGGNYPEIPELSECKFKIIDCPQIHQNNFKFDQKEHGMRLIEITRNNINQNDHIYSISEFNMINEIFNVSNFNAKDINERIYKSIKVNSNPSKNIMRLTIIGKLEKERYHNLKLFQYSEMGKRLNYYFELLDRIEFENSSQEIQGLDVMKELEDFIAMKKKSEPQNMVSDGMEFDINNIYNKSLDLIKDNWDIDG
jgi:hypothetical protein